MGERALEAARRRATELLEQGESPDLVAILREEYALEPQAAYERAVRAIAETAANGAKRSSEEREDAVERWARGMRGSASLYLALGDALDWLRENPGETAGAQAPALF